MLILNRRELLRILGAFPLAHALSPDLSFAAGSGTGKNLIFINLVGGFDSLAVFPYLNDPNASNPAAGFVEYLRNNRPSTFMLPQNLLSNPTQTYLANEYLGFAPGWSHIRPEFTEGRIKLIQGIGINPGQFPNGSHNICENIYSFGNRNYVGGVSRGWFARLMEQLAFTDNQAFGFGTLNRPDFVTSGINPPLVGINSERMVWLDPNGGNRKNLNIATARDLLSHSNAASPAQEKILNSLGRSLDAGVLMDQINAATNPGGPKALVGNYLSSGTTEISATLKSIARVLSYYDGDNRNRIFYAVQGGWDTHQSQGGFDPVSSSPTYGQPVGSLHFNVSSVSHALRALINDLKARSMWEKTVIVVFSEFGRSARQDGSGGTDHGHGSTFMVLGGPINGGVAGVPPTRAELDQYNWSFPRVAFQNLFAPVVRWFGANDAELFPTSQYELDQDIAGSIIR